MGRYVDLFCLHIHEANWQVDLDIQKQTFFNIQ